MCMKRGRRSDGMPRSLRVVMILSTQNLAASTNLDNWGKKKKTAHTHSKEDCNKDNLCVRKPVLSTCVVSIFDNIHAHLVENHGCHE